MINQLFNKWLRNTGVKKMKYIWFSGLALVFAILASCDLGPDSPRGFSLPEGDVEAGKAVLLKYQCLSCHTLEGVEQEDVVKSSEISVKLGGKSTVVKTYAELVTSVINPSHKIATRYPVTMVQEKGVSKMKVYNDVMTVTELVDLVQFLQTKYELVSYRRTNYSYYDIKRP